MLADRLIVSAELDGTCAFYLVPVDRSGVTRHPYRLVDGRYHTLSVTPLGDRITVKPYEGDLGIFKVGAGGREIKEMAVSALGGCARHHLLDRRAGDLRLAALLLRGGRIDRGPA